jgi:type VI secretion system protein ImpH
MSTPQRKQPVGVIDRLLEEPHGFGFFQAVRLLERWFVQQEGAQAGDVLGRRVRFRNSLSLSFPASEIAQLEAVETPAADSPAEPHTPGVKHVAITPSFMGLLGIAGTLPAFYTEMFARRELYERDGAGRAFLDIFLQRAATLFYQAWRKHRLPVQFESDRRNRFLPYVLSLAGVGQSSLRDRLHAGEGGVSDDLIAYFSGTLQTRPVSASAIRRIVSDYFGVDVRLEQFVGRWYALPEEHQSSLGATNMQLGRGMVCGQRVWQRDLRVRLTIGPLSHGQFRRFLPGGPAALALRELLTLLTGVSLEYEIRVALRAAEVQGVRLGEQQSARLAWDAFLITRAAQADRHDAGYEIHAVA